MFGESGAETAAGKQLQVTKDTTFDNQHVYRECGGRGLCDRSTGECKCFPSFTGEGCRRTTCPNDCSGHGQCRTEANSFFYLGQNPLTPFGNQIPDYSKAVGVPTWGIHWPWLKYQQCHCDAGYEGDDCSLRRCPRGDDPETDCNTDRGKDFQRLTCSFAKTGADTYATKAFFQLRFTDQFGGEYDTRPIKVDVTAGSTMKDAENANSIQDALEPPRARRARRARSLQRHVLVVVGVGDLVLVELVAVGLVRARRGLELAAERVLLEVLLDVLDEHVHVRAVERGLE